jgi:hypothetical protein
LDQPACSLEKVHDMFLPLLHPLLHGAEIEDSPSTIRTT